MLTHAYLYFNQKVLGISKAKHKKGCSPVNTFLYFVLKSPITHPGSVETCHANN